MLIVTVVTLTSFVLLYWSKRSRSICSRLIESYSQKLQDGFIGTYEKCINIYLRKL